MDKKDREKLIRDNFGLVHSCAHKLKGRGIEYDDLFQAGCIGLIKAADNFDESRGLRFSTYAVPVILGEMRRLFRDGGTVKVGRSLKELSLRVIKERERLAHQNGREPSVFELAEVLEMEPSEVAEALSASMPPISLTESEEEGGGQTDIPVPAPDEDLADLLALKEVVGTLPPRDRTLIILRYFGSKTQSQTAEVMGMTQVQVSRREKAILNELRRMLTG